MRYLQNIEDMKTKILTLHAVSILGNGHQPIGSILHTTLILVTQLMILQLFVNIINFDFQFVTTLLNQSQSANGGIALGLINGIAIRVLEED